MRHPRIWLRFSIVVCTALLCCSIGSGLAQQAQPKPPIKQKLQQPEKKPSIKQTLQKHERPTTSKRKRGGGLRPEMFERPNRHQWQKPELVIKHMGVRPGQVIADIGAGSGYFTRRFAKAVGNSGIVYACDVDEKMLRYIQNDCKKRAIHNVVTVLAAQWSPMLPPRSVDIVFLCNTNHHIKDRVTYYRNLKKVFKPGGKLVIVDLFKHKKFGPPPEHKLAREVVLKELAEAGYKLIEDNVELLPNQYYLVFEPTCE